MFAATPTCGVFAKKFISHSTVFGPFICELVDDKTLLPENQLLLEVETFDFHWHSNNDVIVVIQVESEEMIGRRFVKADDETQCNWMMFVRTASNYSDQNLVAFQYQNHIFFMTDRDIKSGSELKVRQTDV